MPIRAALFDFGGVVTSSPFEAFARYEQDHGLPADFVRGLNATNPDTNAWARLERNEIDVAGFRQAYEAEALAAGHALDALAVLGCLSGDVRPAMVTAIRRCRERLRTGCITNNVASMQEGPGWAAAFDLGSMFDVVIESSKVGFRKPDPRIYELACEGLEVAPSEVVFLDDLGVNLKPAKAIGMTTIKVVDPEAALRELTEVVGFPIS
jgi:putative hydrolase of the HAD superfamily